MYVESLGKTTNQAYNRHKLVKEESFTKNREFSGIKTTHKSEIIPRVNK